MAKFTIDKAKCKARGEAYKKAVVFEKDGLLIKTLSLPGLIKIKKQSGR